MNLKITKIYLYLMAIPKSIYVNFKFLSFKNAVKFPILISHRVKLKSLSGRISIHNAPIDRFMIKFGFGDVGIFDKQKSRSILEINGNLVFEGPCKIGHGSKISIGENGTLWIGSGFVITAESSIVCQKSIHIEENVLVSWDVLIIDTDFHKIKDENGKIMNENKEINIGSNVWISCRSLVLKGSYLPNNSVVAANSVVNKVFDGEHQLIGGQPSKVLKQNIYWER